MEFLDAFNAGDLGRSLRLFTADHEFEAGVSDCDYRRRESLRFVGRRAIADWLRFADRDRLTMRSVRLVDDRAAVVDYARRESNTLGSLGHPNGIEPQLASKVAFNTQGPVRISQFANAGNDEACRAIPPKP